MLTQDPSNALRKYHDHDNLSWSPLQRSAACLCCSGIGLRFVRDDNQRDTVSVLMRCFANLGLCVYLAVHLNVPRNGESDVRILL